MPVSAPTPKTNTATHPDAVLAVGIGARVALLAGVVGVAALGSLALRSGPESDHAAVPVGPNAAVVERVPSTGTPAHIAHDAPVYRLGEGAEGDWRLGQQTRYVFGDSRKALPELTIEASQIEPGRYHYEGDLVIAGNLAQNYVEFTAASVTVTGDIATSNATLIAEARGPERKRPEIIEMARATYFALAGWMHEYERGAITVGGAVTGDAVALVGGRVAVGGSVIGDVTLAASGNEDTYVSLGAHGRTIENFNDWRDPDVFGPDDYTESQRYGQARPEEVIRVGGQTGAGVTMMRATHWFEARAEALNPAPVAPLGTSAPLNTDRPDGTAVQGPQPRGTMK